MVHEAHVFHIELIFPANHFLHIPFYSRKIRFSWEAYSIHTLYGSVYFKFCWVQIDPDLCCCFILFLYWSKKANFYTNPRPLLFQLKNVMVVGIDTYHDSAKKGRSVGGVICSTNNLLTRYYSRTTFQHTGEELVNGIVTSMRGQSPSTVCNR